MADLRSLAEAELNGAVIVATAPRPHGSLSHMIRLRHAVCLLALLIAVHPARAAPLPPEEVIAGWRRAGPHPLVGTIVDLRSGQPVLRTAPEVDDRAGSALVRMLDLGGAKFILLGEVHDNPEHHLLRAGLIDGLTEDGLFGRKYHPPVVSEHIRAEQAPALAEFRRRTAAAEEPLPAATLFGLLAWDTTGWPAARMFEPLYGAIIGARLKLVPGEPARERIRAVARGGEAALTGEERTRLRLETELPPPLASALAGELKGSHCGMLPDTAIPPMATAQRFRDAHLTDALIAEEQIIGPTILLAGNGHVRTDRGVPWHLRLRAPGKTVASVMLVEVADGRNDALAYVPRDPEGRPAADIVILTPRAAREDPCEKMRRHMQKKG
jgi:uncharacterized iron-regulated protein